MLLFFSVARSAQNSQAERANEALGLTSEVKVLDDMIEEGEKMPTDKLVDVSPLARFHGLFCFWSLYLLPEQLLKIEQINATDLKLQP
jgi:hypothetical protein